MPKGNYIVSRSHTTTINDEMNVLKSKKIVRYYCWNCYV